jgi:2-dehydro-3-deoxyphosphogalactonate aldolase
MIPPAAVKALRAVIPRDSLVLPVGGITEDNADAYLAAGASGFGIGSDLYRAGLALDALGLNARRWTNWAARQRRD